jgi:hypothetical protein
LRFGKKGKLDDLGLEIDMNAPKSKILWFKPFDVFS